MSRWLCYECATTMVSDASTLAYDEPDAIPPGTVCDECGAELPESNETERLAKLHGLPAAT